MRLLSDNTFQNIGPVLLNGEFVKETLAIKSLLLSVKAEFDRIDAATLSLEDQINFIEIRKEKIFSSLTEHFEKIWSMVKNFSDFEYKVHQKYYQNQLIPLLCVPPLNKRIYEKPLGYDGDYITMGYYYRDGYEGDTLYEKLIHRYTLSIPISRAVINRLPYFCEQMDYAVSRFDGPVYISSIGSGPAKEVIEFIRGNSRAEKCVFNCLDSENQALEQVKCEVGEIERKFNKKININYFNHDILQFIKKSKRGFYPLDQHLIYSTGLFDYLNDKVASRLIKCMFSLLAEGGKLIITNFRSDIPSRAYLEFLGEWYLILRDKEDMMRLISEIKDAKMQKIELDETKTQYFLILEK